MMDDTYRVPYSFIREAEQAQADNKLLKLEIKKLKQELEDTKQRVVALLVNHD